MIGTRRRQRAQFARQREAAVDVVAQSDVDQREIGQAACGTPPARRPVGVGRRLRSRDGAAPPRSWRGWRVRPRRWRFGASGFSQGWQRAYAPTIPQRVAARQAWRAASCHRFAIISIATLPELRRGFACIAGLSNGTGVLRYPAVTPLKACPSRRSTTPRRMPRAQGQAMTNGQQRSLQSVTARSAAASAAAQAQAADLQQAMRWHARKTGILRREWRELGRLAASTASSPGVVVSLVLALAVFIVHQRRRTPRRATPRPGCSTSGTASGASVASPLLFTDVHMDVSGMIARVPVSQRFVNPTAQWREGVYVFPLPDKRRRRPPAHADRRARDRRS